MCSKCFLRHGLNPNLDIRYKLLSEIRETIGLNIAKCIGVGECALQCSKGIIDNPYKFNATSSSIPAIKYISKPPKNEFQDVEIIQEMQSKFYITEGGKNIHVF